MACFFGPGLHVCPGIVDDFDSPRASRQSRAEPSSETRSQIHCGLALSVPLPPASCLNICPNKETETSGRTRPQRYFCFPRLWSANAEAASTWLASGGALIGVWHRVAFTHQEPPSQPLACFLGEVGTLLPTRFCQDAFRWRPPAAGQWAPYDCNVPSFESPLKLIRNSS